MDLRPGPLLLAALLAAACNDGAPVDSASGTGTTSGSSGFASSSGQVPTTSPTTSGEPSTGASDSMSGTTSTTSATATTTTQSTGEPGTGTDTASTGAPVDTTGGGSTGQGSSTGQGGCAGPDDCPAPAVCRDATCDMGTCGEQLQPAGTACAGGVCDDGGACVECLGDGDCPMGQICLDAVCAAPSCMNGKKDGGETSADCGGPDCPPCDPGKTCKTGTDCTSGVCTGGVCQVPTCSDMAKNGSETDADCGGLSCPKCQDGKTCLAPTDCQSNDCSGGACKPAPTCVDGLKNGQETDVDCGGPTCPKCQNNQSCLAASDCVSNTCTAGKCVAPGPSCLGNAVDPSTGQKCPLFMSCTQNSDCGVFQGCQQWFCNNSKTCELNALVGCWTNKGGGCNAGVVFVQQDDPPVDKRFVPPDGVNFREVASLAFTVYNNTASDIYLDKLPVQLDLMGNASKFDVSSAKIFDNSGGSEHDLGDILVCLTADPFSFPANGVLGPCAGSSFSRVPKNSSHQFIVDLAFAKEKTFISGRSYRLKVASTAGVVFKNGFNGPDYAGTMCGVPPEGFTGAWVTAQTP